MAEREALRIEIDTMVVAERLRALRQDLGTRLPQRVMQRTLAAVAKDIRQTTRSWPAPTRVRRAAVRTVGWSAKRGKYVVGFGAGARKQQARPAGRPGQGISKQNIHWFVLGTGERRTSRGLARGRIDAYLKGAVARGTAKLLHYFTTFAEQEIEKHKARR